MRKATLFLLATSIACATGPEVKPIETPAVSRLEADRSVATTLRAITARVRKGEADKVRKSLEEQASQLQGDPKLKLYLAWIGAPSEEAWLEINALAKLNPDDPWMWTALGLIYLEWKGFLDQAQGELERALKAVPGFVPAEVGLADVLRKREKLAEAKLAYEAVLAKAPDWEEALVGLGLTLEQMGDPAAKGLFERALKVDPDDVRAIRALAKIAVEAKDADLAIALQSKLLEFDPQNAEARVAVGRMKLQKGDIEGAAADFEAAMEVSPNRDTAQALADAYRALARAHDEIRVLERLAQYDEADPAPLLRVAELRQADKDLEGAEGALRQAAERKPDDAAIQLTLARLLRQRDDLVGSIEAYRLARERGAEGVDQELAELEKTAALPDKPLRGGINRLYNDVFRRLNKEFLARQEANRNLGGKFSVKVTIGEGEKAASVELIEDTVHDPVLAALVYFCFKDASYPKEKPRTVTFEYVLAGTR
ncbi:MAG: tetratricopeptide repeat protein [Myxococcales bacterium]|jgi:tetratricopeptide (TPR) repeat protein